MQECKIGINASVLSREAPLMLHFFGESLLFCLLVLNVNATGKE